MSPTDLSPTAPSLQQVYLLERDAGLLCRILGLYAARSVDVLHVDYEYAAQQIMKLRVSVAHTVVEEEQVLRVLVEKASTFIGVLAASDHPVISRSAAAR